MPVPADVGLSLNDIG